MLSDHECLHPPAEFDVSDRHCELDPAVFSIRVIGARGDCLQRGLDIDLKLVRGVSLASLWQVLLATSRRWLSADCTSLLCR